MLDLLKYEKKSKKNKLCELEKVYEHLLIESTKSELVKSKSSTRARKHASHLENEIHKVLIQWTEAELVKKKYLTIRQALVDDSVKFESSLSRIEDMLNKQREEIMKLENVREEAAEMRIRATAATAAEAARAHDAEHNRASERVYFAQRFAERKRELEKLEKRIFPPQEHNSASERVYFAQRFAERKRELEKRIFPPQARQVVRQDSTRSTEGEAVTEESSAAAQMEEIFQRLMKLTGVTDTDEVFDRFRAQRETSKRLNYLQQTTEEEKLELESSQTALMAELEAFKFASVKDKDEGQDQINELKEEIRKEEETQAELEDKLEELTTVLLDIKRLLYDLCKMLDVIPEPTMPEWTAEARDVQELVQVLTQRYDKACARADEIRIKHGETTLIAVPSNPTSRPSSVAGVSVSHSTPKETEKAVPTYKELVQKEPVRGPASDEEEDIPSRCYLKRQAQLIIDTKCRRKGFRGFPRK
ncbi:golgin subfamily A member 5 [Ostrinia nubilalis]|uniref:golgin subfamily A member 5 n=1 Tax=Ostrinia nubilalis TaxID=29057 RepID=UPI0030825CA8